MRPRGGKARKSRRTKIASPGAAERHQGRLPPREDLGTIASPPQSDLRATNVAWQPGVAARRDLAPVDPFARGALRPSAHPASVVAARSQRALRLAERRTPARTREVGRRGMADKATVVGHKACAFWVSPGARWLRTCRTPVYSPRLRFQTPRSANEAGSSPSRRRQPVAKPACLSSRSGALGPAPKFDSTPRRCGWLHAGARARSSTGVTGAGAALSHGLAPRPSVLNEKQLRRSYIFPADSAGDGKGLAQEVSVFDSASKKKTAARAALVGRY